MEELISYLEELNRKLVIRYLPWCCVYELLCQKNKYPWMAALLSSNGGQFCGATLVASKYVVTAAHCMFFDQDGKQPLSTSDVQVRLGDHDLSVTGETTIAEKTVAVAKINNHESYAPAGGSLNNDITVLELAEEVDINIYTPACLAQTSDTTTFDGKTMLHFI